MPCLRKLNWSKLPGHDLDPDLDIHWSMKLIGYNSPGSLLGHSLAETNDERKSVIFIRCSSYICFARPLDIALILLQTPSSNRMSSPVENSSKAPIFCSPIPKQSQEIPIVTQLSRVLSKSVRCSNNPTPI